MRRMNLHGHGFRVVRLDTVIMSRLFEDVGRNMVTVVEYQNVGV